MTLADLEPFAFVGFINGKSSGCSIHPTVARLPGMFPAETFGDGLALANVPVEEWALASRGKPGSRGRMPKPLIGPVGHPGTRGTPSGAKSIPYPH
jgi:hypothetical protein